MSEEITQSYINEISDISRTRRTLRFTATHILDLDKYT